MKDPMVPDHGPLDIAEQRDAVETLYRIQAEAHRALRGIKIGSVVNGVTALMNIDLEAADAVYRTVGENLRSPDQQAAERRLKENSAAA